MIIDIPVGYLANDSPEHTGQIEECFSLQYCGDLTLTVLPI